MLEVLFGESAAASMAMAAGKAAGSTIGIISGRSSKGGAGHPGLWRGPTDEVPKEKTAPLPESRADIINLPLDLSVGDIGEEGIGPGREAAIRKMMSIFPEGEEVAEEMIRNARRDLSRLLERVKNGEPMRIWSSSHPDEMCGLYWMAEQLRPVGFDKLKLTLVRLPAFEERPGGVVVQYVGWGEVGPDGMRRLASEGRRLPTNWTRAMANQWKSLMEENAPLRAVVNGQLVSAPETLYDHLILGRIAAEKDEFMEASVVGTVLGRHHLGIRDAWVALRIEEFIREGMLTPVTAPAPGDPLYHRLLRKGQMPAAGPPKAWPKG